MAKISFALEEKETEKLHGNQVYETDNDFSSKSELKDSIKQLLRDFTCPECGGHKVKGSGVMVEMGKVRMYREVEKKGLFGGTKYAEEHIKDVWRVYGVGLRSGAFLGPDPGILKCKNCDWEEKGGKGYKLVSVKDIFSGNL